MKHEYGEHLNIEWKAHPLVIEAAPGRRPNDHTRESWAQAAELGASDGIIFRQWPDDRDMPTHSIPALEAGKCAELQGAEIFLAYHEALLHAFFEENRDISDYGVLLEVAAEMGLDLRKFANDLVSGEQRAAIISDLKDAQRDKINGIPTALFQDSAGVVRIVGEVTIEQYRRLTEWLLAT